MQQYLPVFSLYKKEVWRFLKVYNQTLFAPIINSLLFLAVFDLAIGSRNNYAGQISFSEFMSAGLIIMTITQQSFTNSSSSLIMGKVLGNIIDTLMPPFKPVEIILAYTAASITRGLMVGVLTSIVIYFVMGLSIHNIWLVLLVAILASMLMGLLGILAGILSEIFDQMSAITSYLITPMTFLSGTFYSINRLPEFWYIVSQYNPFFYMIDSFRYAVTGYADSNIITGLTVMFGLNIVLWIVVQHLIKIGYRIKS